MVQPSEFALLKATGEQTEGRFTAMELRAPRGFASPLHIHRAEDEFFVVLSGEVRVQHGDVVMEAVAGSIVYGPRDVAHAFHVKFRRGTSAPVLRTGRSRGFFRDAGKPAGFLGLPPADEEFLDRDALKAIGARYNQEFVGPPLPPKA